MHNETIKKYLKLVEKTEPPILHHIWSLISMMSANLGRRCWFEFGSTPIYPNQYILLVGDPGVRKSTAMSLAKKMIKGNRSIRIAPDDTGGQRQGLIMAMLGQEDSMESMLEGLTDCEFSDLAEDDKSAINLDSPVSLEDRHTMYVFASEFASFIGQSCYELVTFLTKIWDGEDHNYTLKNSKQILEKPLLNLLGGTTPTAMSQALPLEVVGQGFLSRVILVYAESSVKIARPQALAEEGVAELHKIFDYVAQNFNGAFKETANASEFLDSLYFKDHHIADTRFVYYMTRRHTHLIKLTMALAALRGSQEIIREDVEDAEELLSLTEKAMPSALGEFGLSPLGAARQKLLDYLNSSPDPYTMNNLWSLMQKDMKWTDFRQTLHDLVEEDKILVWENDNVLYYTGKSKSKRRNRLDSEMEGLLNV